MLRNNGFMKTESLRKERIIRMQSAIVKHMSLNGISEAHLAERMNVTVKTIQNRIKHPEKMQVEDLWSLADLIKCPVFELCSGESPEEIAVRVMAHATKLL